MTKSGMCTHQVHSRTHMKNRYFCSFFIFSWTDDFVADFRPCAWCPHILIGVLGGRVLLGDPSCWKLGVPDSSSTIWGLLKFCGKLNSKQNPGSAKMRLIMRKSGIICLNIMFWSRAQWLEHIFLFLSTYMYCCDDKKNSATLRPSNPPNPR